MKGIFGVLLTILLCPFHAMAQANSTVFRFSDGGTATVREIVVGDPAAVDTLGSPMAARGAPILRAIGCRHSRMAWISPPALWRSTSGM